MRNSALWYPHSGHIMISVSRTMIPQQHFANISGKQKLVQPWVSTTQAKYKKKRKKKVLHKLLGCKECPHQMDSSFSDYMSA